MLKIYQLLKATITNFLDDDSLSKGAAISFYTVTSFAPLLLMVIGIAGLVFGHDAAEGAIVKQLGSFVGQDNAGLFQSILANASNKMSGTMATIIGIITLIVASSGVFSEMQSALNTIWKVETKVSTISRFVRARAASLGLVVAFGFLLMVSLVVSAGLTAFGGYLETHIIMGRLLMLTINSAVSFLLIAFLFAAIFKVLPDRSLEWRDVAVGATASTVLFSVGKFLIAYYIGTTGIGSTYGAAGALMLVLLWVYYSVQIFLLGAEFTKAYANLHGSKASHPVTTTKKILL